MKKYDQYTFFYNGPFSNWYQSQFKDMRGRNFLCVEQYMMYNKAMLFQDLKTAEKIMQTKEPGNQKALGRQVKNFDATRWNEIAREVVALGCFYKFSQNSKLYSDLMKTKGTLLVEASPTDTIWGIGLGERDIRILDRKNWQGTNWLGEVLTDLRDNFLRNNR